MRTGISGITAIEIKDRKRSNNGRRIILTKLDALANDGIQRIRNIRQKNSEFACSNTKRWLSMLMEGDVPVVAKKRLDFLLLSICEKMECLIERLGEIFTTTLLSIVFLKKDFPSYA